MSESAASERIKKVLAGIPSHVAVLAAAKTRSAEEVQKVIEEGIHIIGHNYVQEAAASLEALGRPQVVAPTEECAASSIELSGHIASDQVAMHLIGHLQRNKAKLAVRLFDCIQTVDSLRLAHAIDREAQKVDRIMSVLIEVNSGREPQKAGVPPEAVTELIRDVAQLASVRVDGLMTMGPLVSDPERIRPAFAETKRLFDELGELQLPNVAMRVLSMGMSNSYRVAIEEGATMIRLGTVLFGPRAT